MTAVDESQAARAREGTACPVCGAGSQPGDPIPGWGEWRICGACTLEFADPLGREQDPIPWFSDAYRGEIADSEMTDFHKRLDQRRVILDELAAPELWFWTPAFDQVMAWLKSFLEPGSTVLDVGCGLGFFLHALRNEGFNAVGLDVADAAVELNRRDGFEVWQGPVESMPHGWQRPDAVVSFFMVHHLEEPRAFLSALHERTSGAPLAIAAYGPTNKADGASLPPRTLIRWNSEALATALRLTGYGVEVRDVRSTGSELGPVVRARRILARTSAYPRLYKAGKAIEERVLNLIPEDARADAYVVLALARPGEPSEDGG